MTSWDVTYIFVFVFLNAIDPSKEGCYNLLDDWANLTNLKDTFSIVTTEDPKVTVNCSLEAECLQKEDEIGCSLLEECLEKPRPNMTSPECKGNISQVHAYHFRCLMAKAFDHALEGCEYNTVCKIYSEIASTPSDLTTTPRTTTPPTTTPSTTTPPTTPTATTTTLPETTTVLPSPITATSKPTATKLAPESSFAQVGNNETLKLRGFLKEKQEETDKLKTLLWLSLVFHAILPLAVYLYMRHRQRRDKIPSNLTQFSNGNLTGDPTKKEGSFEPTTLCHRTRIDGYVLHFQSDAPPARQDAENTESTHLMKRDKHPDDVVLNCFSGEDQTQL